MREEKVRVVKLIWTEDDLEIYFSDNPENPEYLNGFRTRSVTGFLLRSLDHMIDTALGYIDEAQNDPRRSVDAQASPSPDGTATNPEIVDLSRDRETE